MVFVEEGDDAGGGAGGTADGVRGLEGAGVGAGEDAVDADPGEAGGDGGGLLAAELCKAAVFAGAGDFGVGFGLGVADDVEKHGGGIPG